MQTQPKCSTSIRANMFKQPNFYRLALLIPSACTLLPAYFYRKDERAFQGNIHSSNFSVAPVINVVYLTSPPPNVLFFSPSNGFMFKMSDKVKNK
jgi:hypothetical protein